MEFKHLRKIAKFRNNRWVNTVRTYFKDFYDKTIETNSQLKLQFLQFLPFLVASVITGLVAFLYSKVFSYAEHISFYIYEKGSWSIFIITPLSFLASWYMVKRFSPYARGSGIPQVMAALQIARPKTSSLITQYLSIRIILVKVLSSLFKVIGGGLSGREGPTIQIASSIFNQIYRWLPSWWTPISQKNIIVAGAASGLAAAFNTPLGGIIFAIEELSKFHIKYYKSPLFIAVIIAGLTAQGIGGSYLYLGYPKISTDGWMVVLGVLLVAIICGYFGAKMCVILRKIMAYFSSIKGTYKQVGLTLACGLFVASFIYSFGTDAMGSGKELMERTLFTADKSVEWYMPFVRMNSLIASFSFGGAGGIFAPSLSCGVSFGALIADLLNLNSGNTDLLIIIGMTAFLTGVTRAPFTSAIIVFEMTDRHSVIFFLLLGAILANIFASFVDKKSFYDYLKGYYLEDLFSRKKKAAGNDKD